MRDRAQEHRKVFGEDDFEQTSEDLEYGRAFEEAVQSKDRLKQIEKEIKDWEPLPATTSEGHRDKQKGLNALKEEEARLIKARRESSGMGGRDRKTGSAQPSKPGRKVEGLTQAIEHLFNELNQEGNIDITREENIGAFLKRLKESINEKSGNFSIFISERISKVKTTLPYSVTTQEREVKRTKGSQTLEKSRTFNKEAIKKRLNALRKNNKLSI